MSQPASTLSTPLPAARLIAILAADAAGYSRLMAVDDRLTVELLDAARAVFREACDAQQGRVVDMAGDSVLLAFASAASALRCALLVQQRLLAQANPQTGTLRLPFRIGVHLGDVIEKADGSVYGDGVNIAARLQALAEPDEVFVSQAVRDTLGARPVARFEEAGEHQLKNVPHPVRAWRALPPGDAAPKRSDAPASASTASLRFAGRYELQPVERRLLVDGQPAALGARAFDLLLVLAGQPGALLTKNQLLERVWPGLVVEEGNLATQISTLRKLLGGEVIATIPGRGYRFTAHVETGAAPAAPAASPTPPAPPGPPPADAPAPAAKLQTNLPAALPHLVGRTEDMAALGELIGQHRLVSIVGAGGMGKTTLALHLTANRQAAYPHGVCWVELATVADAEALPAAIAAAIGVGIGSGDPLKGLCGALAPLTMLLALDNAEQVVDGVARLVQAVLDKAPGVRFVVTTQVPLKLASEMVYRIGPLTLPQGPLPAAQALGFSAVALFVDRARMADARFTLTDANAPAVIGLCRQLDGLALAIELAAARAPMLGVQRLAASMGDRLKVLTSSRNRMAPARQQTLRAALEWSHGFLEERERAVFRRLAVFAGSASLTLVLQVVPDAPGEGDLDEWAVLDALALLVDRSLVLALTPDDAAEPRYRLLDTPRLFARERLQQAGEEAALRQRHARAVVTLFEAAAETYYAGTVRIDAWELAIAADLDNGREALAWARAAGDADAVARIAATMGRALGKGGYREGLALAEAVEPLIERIDDADLLARLCNMFAGAVGTTQSQRALMLVRRCVACMPPVTGSGAPATRWAHHLALTSLAATEARDDLPAAETALAQARALVEPSWPPARSFWLLEAEHFVARARGDMAAFLDWIRRHHAVGVANGRSTGILLSNLVDAELAAGNPAQAAHAGAVLVAQLAGGRDEYALSVARLNLSAALLALGGPEQARPHLRAGWAQAALFDLQPFFADYLALLAALEGRPEAAARLAGYADVGNARVGEREPNEAAAVARAVQLAHAALGDAAFDRLHAEGAALRDADIEAIAFGEDVGA
jgi:predicted ATPase/class 3 adenylate cyclase/DNA-binding winged helix-turn-helix (wHTH) protein